MHTCKMRNYALWFKTQTCFGHHCDNLQGVLLQEFVKYTNDYIRMNEKKTLQGSYQLISVNNLL